MTIKAVCLDISGVLYESNEIIEGALDCVHFLRRAGLLIRFVTNTASQNSKQITAHLARMGILVASGELFTAPLAARQYIVEHGFRPFCIIHDNLRADFVNLPQSHPNVVLLGDARDGLSYANLNLAFQLCKKGAPLVAIGMNKFFSEHGELMLDAGAFVHAIEWAADCQAVIMGKPSEAFYQQVVKSLGCPAEHCVMVGDDVLSDVQGAMDAGLHAILVRTGKYRKQDDALCPESANIINSIAALPGLLKNKL
jgi:HAD superfamily hydrolase (TIGR01458 family)